MKKKVFTLACLMLFLLASCGASKWNCTKRYCNATELNYEIDPSVVQP
ncbi:hypothetical protein [Pseudofulvibacter geojedonensis]|uniref:Lipoprotein n=1 Tax=Pseudofulvibacter geojedonensis TaxID=1123758 RepID=A0ABW3I188_9FLAO